MVVTSRGPVACHAPTESLQRQQRTDKGKDRGGGPGCAFFPTPIPNDLMPRPHPRTFQLDICSLNSRHSNRTPGTALGLDPADAETTDQKQQPSHSCTSSTTSSATARVPTPSFRGGFLSTSLHASFPPGDSEPSLSLRGYTILSLPTVRQDRTRGGVVPSREGKAPEGAETP